MSFGLTFYFPVQNRGTGGSLVAKLLEKNVELGKGEEGEETIKRVAAVAYVGKLTLLAIRVYL